MCRAGQGQKNVSGNSEFLAGVWVRAMRKRRIYVGSHTQGCQCTRTELRLSCIQTALSSCSRVLIFDVLEMCAFEQIVPQHLEAV